MPPYKVEVCSIADVAELARSNMSAYWEDPSWVLLWEGKSLDYIIEQQTKRLPKGLITDREHRRHQKLVDQETGAIVGYCRWVLPDRLTGQWLDAQVAGVSKKEEKEFAKSFASADWNHRSDMDVLDDPVRTIIHRIKGQKEYMELDWLAVHPDHKGRGIATMLVESGIAEAEKMGIDIYVLAFKAALGVYQRLGFEMLDHLIQDDSMFGGKGEYGTYFLERVSKEQT